MSSRFTSPFDDLLERNRRELDALYRDAGPSRTSRTPAIPTASEPARGSTSRIPEGAARRDGPPPSSATAASGGTSADSPAERLLNERYGNAWRFEVTSRRREKDEAIVVGTLRLPGSGGVRTQFGSARISASGAGAGSGSAGGIDFSFGGAAAERPLAAEEAAFRRAHEDALASCTALL